VHWDSEGSSLYEVMADGSLRNIYGPGLTGRSSYGEPLDGTTGAITYEPCAGINGSGAHTWLVRATLKTKHAHTDVDPFKAKVGASALIHCG
jgi:hypothetical protein